MKTLKFLALYIFSKDFREYIAKCRSLAVHVGESIEKQGIKNADVSFRVDITSVHKHKKR